MILYMRVAMVAALALASEAKVPLIGSIGPQTTETMKKAGMEIGFEAKKPSLDVLIEALIKNLKTSRK